MDPHCIRKAIDALPDAEVVDLLAPVLARLTQRPLNNTWFRAFENAGVHVLPAGFYEPVPDLRNLPESTWKKQFDLAGIEMNDAYQASLLREAFPAFSEECKGFPVGRQDGYLGYHLSNGMFDGVDALLYYCMIRHFRPKKVVEVGSGYSSLLAAAAAERNNSTEVVCIEPYPPENLLRGKPAPHRIVHSEVQSLDPSFFDALGSGDILFIDSSHCSRIGSDVNFLFLEVIPRLRPGVFVHVHDVFIPFEPYRDAVENLLQFWNEQYLLHAFLLFNSEFRVILANRYLGAHYEKELRELFPLSPWHTCGGSFWIRRKSS